MITPNEAAESLRDVEQVGRRTHVAGAYAGASPHLVVWGLVWIAGYVACGLTRPELWGLIWAPAILAGVIGSFVAGRRASINCAPGKRANAGKSVAMSLICMLFMASVYFVFQPTSLLPYLIFPALVVALTYSLAGVFGLPRFIWIGAGVFVVVMLGYMLAREWMAFWVAAGGGGGLVLGGLWMRRI